MPRIVGFQGTHLAFVDEAVAVDAQQSGGVALLKFFGGVVTGDALVCSDNPADFILTQAGNNIVKLYPASTGGAWHPPLPAILIVVRGWALAVG